MHLVLLIECRFRRSERRSLTQCGRFVNQVMPEGQAPFPGSVLAYSQAIFVESANFADTVHEMNLKNPVTFLSLGVEIRMSAGARGHRPAEVRSLGEFNLITPDHAVREKSQVGEKREKGGT